MQDQEFKLLKNFNPFAIFHIPQRPNENKCNCLSCRSDRLGLSALSNRLTQYPYSLDGIR